MPPTGAKGLNLAVSDVHYLADALVDALAGSTTAVDAYSDRALAGVWKGRSLLVQPAGQVVGEIIDGLRDTAAIVEAQR